MSIQEVERVMQRALREEAFRELLSDDPAVALASYELTPDERAALLEAGHAAALPTELVRPGDAATRAGGRSAEGAPS